jgi:Arc/MetJ-type ribon-helix-helix transcriptional regulator
MLIQTKIQIDHEDYHFIKNVHKKLNYKSQSEYIREAVKEKVKADRLRLRAMKRERAMEMIGKRRHNNYFNTIDEDIHESR